jgi:hypothetical protein
VNPKLRLSGTQIIRYIVQAIDGCEKCPDLVGSRLERFQFAPLDPQIDGFAGNSPLFIGKLQGDNIRQIGY